jgi:hypothetical protein
LTDAADASLRRLFVPAAQAADTRLEIEAREQTPGGFVVSRGLRRVTVIERQERHGHITHRQGCAARELYRCYAFGICGVRDRDTATGGHAGPTGYTDSQIDAAGRFRDAHDRLGHRIFPLVYSITVEDVSVADYARLRGANPTSVQTLLRLGLDLLADLWGIHE